MDLISAWPAPFTPTLPEKFLPQEDLTLNTLSGRKSLTDPNFSVYVCGITPYDATHLGHAATYLTFDLINRYLLAQGKSVTYAQNITDVDDPLLERAKRDHVAWQDLANSQIDLFRSDMSALHILPPKYYVPVTANIKQMANFVAALVAQGHTYEIAGDIYFKITPYLPNLPIPTTTANEIFSERGGDPDRVGKEHPLDPLLWRAPRDGDPSWETVLGGGRPGWHIECSVIALETLGNNNHDLAGKELRALGTSESSITLQGGGSDLIFPHHFMSAAQVSALTGKPFAKYFVNSGMVGLNGVKMSKSLGNLVLVSKLLAAGNDAMDIRFALLSMPWESDRMWSDDILETAKENLKIVRKVLSKPLPVAIDKLVKEMNQALSDNLNTVKAVELLVDWCKEIDLKGEKNIDKGELPDNGGVLSRYLDFLLGLAL